MATLTPEMLASLYARAIEDGKTFPLKLTLQVEGEVVEGFMYEDGSFHEGETEPQEPGA